MRDCAAAPAPDAEAPNEVDRELCAEVEGEAELELDDDDDGAAEVDDEEDELVVLGVGLAEEEAAVRMRGSSLVAAVGAASLMLVVPDIHCW